MVWNEKGKGEGTGGLRAHGRLGVRIICLRRQHKGEGVKAVPGALPEQRTWGGTEPAATEEALRS